MMLFSLIILPLTFMILSLLIKKAGIKKRLAILMAGLNFFSTLVLVPIVHFKEIIVVNMGSWPAPYGISLVADRFSVFMLVVSAVIFFITIIYSTQAVDKPRRKNGFYFFSFGILMGVNGSFVAGDIFNLYVWFEVMLMSSFILISLGGERAQLEGAIKYLILNLISSFFFVAGIGLLYGKLGTLNLADLSYKMSQINDLSLISPALILIFVGFSIKGALFPFFYWLPASYHTPPPAVSALFAGLLTKVGIYAIIRLYTLLLYHNEPFWSVLLLWIGGLSMVIGVIAASSQYDFRKILSFHIISQMGYVIISLAFNTVAGLTAAIFFLGHNMLAKTNAFLVAGWVYKSRGTLDLKSLGDVFRQSRIWGFLFFISAFSLAGLPPLSGFAAKYLVLKAGIEAHHLGISLVALFVGLFTLFSMVKIWMEVFWKPTPSDTMMPLPPMKQKDKWMVVSSVMLAIAIIGMGIWAKPIVDYCQLAAADLLNPSKYIYHVLGL